MKSKNKGTTAIVKPPLSESADRYICDMCAETFPDPSGFVRLYECGDCGTRFTRETSDNYNHQCPSCHKFGAFVSDDGCPECNEGEVTGPEKTGMGGGERPVPTKGIQQTEQDAEN